MLLDATSLNTQVRIKGKVEESKERNSGLHIPRCCSCCKGSLRVALDYGR